MPKFGDIKFLGILPKLSDEGHHWIKASVFLDEGWRVFPHWPACVKYLDEIASVIDVPELLKVKYETFELITAYWLGVPDILTCIEYATLMDDAFRLISEKSDQTLVKPARRFVYKEVNRMSFWCPEPVVGNLNLDASVHYTSNRFQQLSESWQSDLRDMSSEFCRRIEDPKYPSDPRLVFKDHEWQRGSLRQAMVLKFLLDALANSEKDSSNLTSNK